MGAELMVLVFIVVIIGGLGSVTGCFIGALLVALATTTAAFCAEAGADQRHRPEMVAVLLLASARTLPGDQPMMWLSGDPPRSKVLTVSR